MNKEWTEFVTHKNSSLTNVTFERIFCTKEFQDVRSYFNSSDPPHMIYYQVTFTYLVVFAVHCTAFCSFFVSEKYLHYQTHLEVM